MSDFLQLVIRIFGAVVFIVDILLVTAVIFAALTGIVIAFINVYLLLRGAG